MKKADCPTSWASKYVKEPLAKDTARLPFIAALLLIGISWSATYPLSKVAVSSGHAPLGITFWQQIVVAVVLGALLTARLAIFRHCDLVLRLYHRGGGDLASVTR